MSMELPAADRRAQLKQQAAEYATTCVEPGMVLGLGAGSTALFALRKIAALLASGQLYDVVGVPCSGVIAAEAERLGIPLTTLNDDPVIQLTIDGADEVDPELNLIKGGGGALLYEKIVASASLREIIVVDDEKLSAMLGTRWAVPIEVLQFGWRSQAAFLEQLGAEVSVRLAADGAQFITDEGNLILDCRFGPIAHPAELAAKIAARAGIVEHGLFLGLASDLVVAGQDGIRHLRRTPSGSIMSNSVG